MRPPSLSLPPSFAAVPPLHGPAAEDLDLRALPPRLDASPAIASHARGGVLFIASAWLAAAGLSADDKRMLSALLVQFWTGQAAVPDMNQECEQDSVLLRFDSGTFRRCEAACAFNAQGEVLRIVIRAQDQQPLLTLSKPAQEVAPAARANAGASSSARVLQNQLQMSLDSRQVLKHKGFTDVQLNQICKHSGGAEALRFIAANWGQLTGEPMKLTKDDIAKITSHDGAKPALEAVVADWGTLTGEPMKLTKDDIVKVASHDGAKPALEAVVANWDKLTALGLRKGDIVKIASNIGGKYALEAVTAGWGTLTGEPMKLTKDDIVKIASNNGGKHALEAVADNWGTLTGEPMKLAKDDIVKIASNGGATQALKAVADNWGKLTALGLGKDDIVNIASNSGATQALKAVADNWGTLTALGLGKDDIVKIASNDGTKHALEAVVAKWDELTALGLGKDDIVKIASNSGAKHALEAVVAKWDELTALGLGKDDILNIASNSGATQALKAVADNWGTLTALGLGRDDIVKIASNSGAKQALDAVVTMPWHGQLSKEDLVKLTSRNSGANILHWYLEHHMRLKEHGLSTQQILTAAISTRSAVRERILKQAGIELEPGASGQRGHKRGMTSAVALAKKIKTEPLDATRPFRSTFPAPVREVEIAPINTVQARHTPVTRYPMIDLTAEGGDPIGVMTVFNVHHMQEAALVTGKQTYHRELDQRFPIRDPANPTLVHPDYADPADPTRCAEKVSLQNAYFLKGGRKPPTKWGSKSKATGNNEDELWRLLTTNFGKDHPYQARRGTSMKKMFIASLLRSCEQELQACIAGTEPPSARRVKVMPVTAEQCDSPEEAQALAGQYGGILQDYAKDKQPSLRNGRIVCLFAGARLETEAERTAYFGQLGAEVASQAQHDYSATVRKHGTKKMVDWAPYGGGNMAQYLNSSFQADGTVDQERCNACFVPVTFDLTKRDGETKRETMLAVIQFREIEEGKQIKLDYGAKYRLEPSGAAPMETAAS